MEPEQLVCEVVSWTDEPRADSGWHRIRVRALDDREHVVTGANLPRPGSRCEFIGKWEDRGYGDQFHVRSIKATRPPLTAAGVARWLEDRCAGIGPVKAAAIMRAFNGDAAALWAALARGAGELAAIDAIGQELAERVHEAYEQDGAAREHYATLRGLELTQAQINRVTKHWAIDKACKLIYNDPYLLCEHVNGFGFKRADAVADRVGIEKRSRVRIRAGVLHCMSEAAQQGHVFGDFEMFQHMSQTFLSVPVEETTAVVQELLKAKRLVSPDDARIYLPSFELAERESARITQAMLFQDAGPRTDAKYSRGAQADIDRIVAAEGKEPWKLEPEQCAAIDLVADMSRPVGFITGGPGTGKTTILEHACAALEAQGIGVTLAAPTGKAAKRMAEATGRDAMTLHRMLGFKPEYDTDCDTCRNIGKNPYMLQQIGFLEDGRPRQAIIVDEASMVDLQLWAALVRAIDKGQYGAVVRFVGDANQLPPVGPGQPFADHLKALEHSPVLQDAGSVVRLGQVKRQGKESWVAQAAPLILQGKMPSIVRRKDFRFFETIRADHIPSLIEQMLLGELDSDDWSAECLRADYKPKNVRTAPTGAPAPVLVPQKKGLAGVATINKLLVEHYAPHAAAHKPEDLLRIDLEDSTDLRIGARVMATKNDYTRDVRNGDTGTIEHMELKHDKRGNARPSVFVRLDADETMAKAIMEARRDGTALPQTRLVEYDYYTARAELVLSYAMTVHKSQGSQYPWVIVVCHATHSRMLTRRLLYTAITRASEGVVLVGNREGLQRAVANGQEIKRNSNMVGRLQRVTPQLAAALDVDGWTDDKIAYEEAEA